MDLLRHTQATRLIANGVDIKTAQNRLGHASPTLTMSFYAHALPENDQRAAALVGNLFPQPAKTDSEETKPLRAASQRSTLEGSHVRCWRPKRVRVTIVSQM